MTLVRKRLLRFAAIRSHQAGDAGAHIPRQARGTWLPLRRTAGQVLRVSPHATALFRRAGAKQDLLGGDQEAAALRGADLLQSPDGIGVSVGRAVGKILLKTAVINLAFEQACGKEHLIFCRKVSEPVGCTLGLLDQPPPMPGDRFGVRFGYLLLRAPELGLFDIFALAALAWHAQAAVCRCGGDENQGAACGAGNFLAHPSPLSIGRCVTTASITSSVLFAVPPRKVRTNGVFGSSRHVSPARLTCASRALL